MLLMGYRLEKNVWVPFFGRFKKELAMLVLCF
jgi:hypothetical protein